MLCGPAGRAMSELDDLPGRRRWCQLRVRAQDGESRPGAAAGRRDVIKPLLGRVRNGHIDDLGAVSVEDVFDRAMVPEHRNRL